MNQFKDLGLPRILVDTLEDIGFETPTPIQAQAIPLALEGSDILGSAQTGTGKTAAYMLPLINALYNNSDLNGLVIAPTRELAVQVMNMTTQLLGPKTDIACALLIGGEPMPKQFRQLQKQPRIIIGTPGRIEDHCRRSKKLLNKVRFLVLDEADRMLDMGFSVQVDAILKYMPQERQTLMFSATFSKAVTQFAQRYLVDPKRVAIKADKISADKIKHEVVHVTKNQKFTKLQKELNEREGSIIIFVKTRRGADEIAKSLTDLKHADYTAEPIHGDLRQRQRDRAIKGFRNKEFRILVATDVAARGLDIPHVEHVINYDLPQDREDYVHRIGRTARAGAEGAAMCFVTPQDDRQWYMIQKFVFPHEVNAQDEHSFSKKKSFGKGRFSKPFGNNRYSKQRRPQREGEFRGKKFRSKKAS